jgi:hypothetical protein
MNSSSLRLILLAILPTVAGCGYGTYEYPAAQYVNRTQKITTSAGNAQEINEATQVIDPWLPTTGNRNIPANGDRMVNAAERYRAKTQGGQAGQLGQAGASPVGGSAGTPGTSPTSSPSAPSGL